MSKQTAGHMKKFVDPYIAAKRERLVPTVVRLPPDVHQAVKGRAEQEDRTMAQVVRRAIKQYLEAGS